MKFDVKPVSANPSALKEIRWYEYATRFFFGGLITAAAGLIAKKYGPVVGGLFLAFPAIFPSSATLVEKHEREHKAEKGLHGESRARKAVGTDAAGAAMGSIGLIGFAVAVWQALPELPSVLSIAAATVAWVAISGLFWLAWKRNWIPHPRFHGSSREQHHSV